MHTINEIKRVLMIKLAISIHVVELDIQFSISLSVPKIILNLILFYFILFGLPLYEDR